MTERERALLQGKKINPLTADESALAYAVAHGGGDEPQYETVAEIKVGTMVEHEGMYAYQTSDSIPLARNETLFFNSEEYPLEYDEEGTTYYYNFDGSTGMPTGTPAYGVFLDGSKISTLFSNTDLSNTTVKILKKVEQGGGELPEVTSADNGDVLTVVDGAWAKAKPNPNLKPTYEFGFTGTIGESGIIATADSGVTYAAILAATQKTDNVYVNLMLGTDEFRSLASDIKEGTNGGTSFVSFVTPIYSDFEGSMKFYLARLKIDEQDAVDFVITPVGS